MCRRPKHYCQLRGWLHDSCSLPVAAHLWESVPVEWVRVLNAFARDPTDHPPIPLRMAPVEWHDTHEKESLATVFESHAINTTV